MTSISPLGARVIVDTWHRYRETLDSLLEGFQIIDRSWRYLYVNRAAAGHARLTPDQLHGRLMWDVFPGIDDTPLFATLSRVMTDRSPASFETLFTFPDGSSRWFEIRVQPVAEGICVHSVDIQARKDAEARVREQESVAALGQMAAMVAHEVKNPLAGLSGALQILKQRRGPSDPETAVFDEMLGSIESLDRLVRDMLVFAKPLAIDPAPTPVVDIVEDVQLWAASDARVRCDRLRIECAAPAAIVFADREMLGHVFRNLLLNAAHAIGVTSGEVQFSVLSDATMARFVVADTGPGVRAAIAARIFEPFVTSKKGGTGLGLAISRRIARLHGGDLQLLPSEQGAAFLLTVPLAAG